MGGVPLASSVVKSMNWLAPRHFFQSFNIMRKNWGYGKGEGGKKKMLRSSSQKGNQDLDCLDSLRTSVSTLSNMVLIGGREDRIKAALLLLWTIGNQNQMRDLGDAYPFFVCAKV